MATLVEKVISKTKSALGIPMEDKYHDLVPQDKILKMLSAPFGTYVRGHNYNTWVSKNPEVIFDFEKPNTIDNFTYENQSCYNKFLYNVYYSINNSRPNRFSCVNNFENNNDLNTIKRYYKICSLNNIWPSYTDELVTKNNQLLLGVDPKCDVLYYYIILCLFRLPKESLSTVKKLVFLIDEVGFNFYEALAIVCNYTNIYHDHFFLKTLKTVVFNGKEFYASYANIWHMYLIKYILENPQNTENIEFVKTMSKKRMISCNGWYTTIESISRGNHKSLFSMKFNEAESYVKTLKKEIEL